VGSGRRTGRPVPHAEAPARGGAAAPGRGRWLGLTVVLSAAFMQLIDISIVNVAIPSIQRELGASYGQVQLVVALYQLAFGALLITGGRLGDIVGRKRMFMLGMAGFTVASLACGLAPSPGWLIAARVAQGLTSALLFPQVFSLVQAEFAPAERATAFGIAGAVIGAATIAGPLLGGVLIQADVAGLGWRPIFLVNVPIGIVALVAASRWLHESRGSGRTRLDLAGVAVVTPGLLLLVYPLVQGRAEGWPAWAFASLAAAVGVLAGFAWLERRVAARGGVPLVVPELFADRAFRVGILVSFVFFLGVPAFFLTFTVHLQVGLGFSALGAGLATLPFAVGSATASAASVRLAPRFGRPVLQVGSGLMVVGMLALIATIHLADLDLRSYQLAPALLVAGLGMGLVVAPLIDTVLAGIHGGAHGSASGVLSTMQQVGGAVGVALIGVAFFGLLSSGVGRAAAETAPRLRTELMERGVPPAVTDEVVAGFERCFRDRSRLQDPSAEPPSCRERSTAGAAWAARAGGPDPALLEQTVAHAAEHARGRLFTDAVRPTLLYEVAVFLATLGMLRRLPQHAARPAAGRRGGRPPGGPAA
jgi:EmrB/QacA subfamily drug resistance transporter